MPLSLYPRPLPRSCQVLSGRKVVALWSPADTRQLAPAPTAPSNANHAPASGAGSLLGGDAPALVTVGPGDALFIPEGGCEAGKWQGKGGCEAG
jgi:hypothetical protein